MDEGHILYFPISVGLAGKNWKNTPKPPKEWICQSLTWVIWCSKPLITCMTMNNYRFAFCVAIWKGCSKFLFSMIVFWLMNIDIYNYISMYMIVVGDCTWSLGGTVHRCVVGSALETVFASAHIVIRLVLVQAYLGLLCAYSSSVVWVCGWVVGLLTVRTVLDWLHGLLSPVSLEEVETWHYCGT